MSLWKPIFNKIKLDFCITKSEIKNWDVVDLVCRMFKYNTNIYYVGNIF